MKRAMHSGFLPGNQIALLETGAEFFPALTAAIAAAQHEIQLETYIFADDSTGRRIAAALTSAAQRGVAVRLLVDGFGSREFVAGCGQTLIAGGVQLLVYRPDPPSMKLRRYRLRRLHRKLAVVDGRTAFIGGVNIVDDYNEGETDQPRLDYALRIEGPLVTRIHAAMRHVWRLVRWSTLGRRPPQPPPPPLPAPPCGPIAAALLIRDNLRHRRDIENAYLAAIGQAQYEIVVANAYFLPGMRLRHALRAAARRGVSVVLLLQGRVEHVLQHYATQALYASLLASGIRIYEYRASYLHAKVAVIDHRWATVGSSNIDPFSLLLAREANVVIRNTRFSLKLRRRLLHAIATGATEIRLDDLQRQSWLVTLAGKLAYGIVRLLLDVSGYSRHYAE